ncbi:MAG TPA: aminopeptidase [Thermoleophilaceae bacterium]|nr:aminopeptidase [Thermoleophilaceae bacterium]
MAHLDTAVQVVVRGCLEVSGGERVLLVHDSTTDVIADRLQAAAEAVGAEARPAPIPVGQVNGEEPPPEVAAGMAVADVVIAPTAMSISHTEARRKASAAGTRIATMPGVTEEVLARAMAVDLQTIGRMAKAIAGRLSAASEARITCERGSDLRLSLEGREALVDDGRLGAPGSFGNLPCGEGFIAPLEDRGEGKLVVDGSIGGYGALDEPVELTIEGGRLTAATGDAGSRLLEQLSAAGGENVAELGVGCNGRARVSGNVLEDEKVLGTVHLAFGASASCGGVVQVPVHLDCVLLRPELALDGEPLVSGGRLSA